MPYLSFSELKKQQGEKKNALEFDFIVIGAGSSGCPLASRLSEDLSVTVLLVEAGLAPHQASFEDSLNRSVPAGCGKLQQSSTSCYHYFTEPDPEHSGQSIRTSGETHKFQAYWPRGKGIGGSSGINYMAYVRGHANDYNEWENKYGAKGWAWHHLEPLFQRIENVSECPPHGGVCPRCHGYEGPLGISQRKPTPVLAADFVQSAKALGYPQGDYNCFCGSGNHNKRSEKDGMVGFFQQTVRQGTRCDTGRAYIDPLMVDTKRRPNLFVLTGTKCQKIVTKKEGQQLTATAVELVPDGPSSVNTSDDLILSINCTKEIILSAGALASPQILLQSGIGPEGVVLDLPEVGQHLQDHLMVCLRFNPKKGQGKHDIGSINKTKAEGITSIIGNMLQMYLNHAGPLSSSAYDATLFYPSKTGLSYPDLQIGMLNTPGDRVMLEEKFGIDMKEYGMDAKELAPGAEGMLMTCTMLHPKSAGYVELRKHDARNYGLRIHHNYLTDPGKEDLNNIIRAMRKGMQLAKNGPLADKLAELPLLPKDLCEKYMVTETSKSEDLTDALLEEFIRRYAVTLYHPVGTCRLGKDKSQGVVDAKLRVFGIQNLRVADASIQPEIVSGNTNASCIVVGEHAAGILGQDHKLLLKARGNYNSEELRDAVSAYESRIFWKRYLVIFAIVVMMSMSIAAIVTVSYWRYHKRNLWASSDASSDYDYDVSSEYTFDDSEGIHTIQIGT